MHQLLAITNDSAGTSSDDAVDAAVDVLRTAFDVEVVGTGSPEELDAALDAHPDAGVIAAFGGDGSLHAVVDAIYRAERLGTVTVALVPLGTGNDFARTLELPTDPVRAARRIIAAEPRAIDLIEDREGSIVVNAASAGLGAEAAVRAKRYKEKFGPIGYVVGAVKSAFVPDARVLVTIDDRPLRSRQGRVSQVSVGNGCFVGGGAALFPEAEVDDGLLDIQVVFAPTLARRAVYALRILTRTAHGSPLIHTERGRRVTVHGEGLRCTSDGELSDPCPDHTWRILPGALRFLY